MWKGTVVLLCVLAVSNAAKSFKNLEIKPEKFKDQEGCYMAEFDKVLPIGSVTPSTENCMAYRCGLKNIVVTSCGIVHADPPLRIVKDKSKPYPDCCPKIAGPETQ